MIAGVPSEVRPAAADICLERPRGARVDGESAWDRRLREPAWDRRLREPAWDRRLREPA